MKELGLNAIRLRVWVNPHDGFCNAQDVLDMAKRARYYGMAIMIDFHYSDWWADPGKQNIPMAWQYGSMWDMKQYVRNHTADVLSLLKKNNIQLQRGKMYDCVYVANMCLNDYFGKSVPDLPHMAMFIRDMIDDPDAEDGFIFNRFYADQMFMNNPIDWEDMI